MKYCEQRGEIFQFNIKGLVTDQSFTDLTGQKLYLAGLAPNPATSTAGYLLTLPLAALKKAPSTQLIF